jgi:hypothetical protein
MEQKTDDRGGGCCGGKVLTLAEVLLKETEIIRSIVVDYTSVFQTSRL